MKAATGELNLTVITLIAIGAVIGFFWLMWPSIKGSLGNQWNEIACKKRDANGKCIEYDTENSSKNAVNNGMIVIDDYIVNFSK